MRQPCLVDHIYGRRESLTPSDRPHVFANELELYLDHFAELERTATGTKGARSVQAFRDGLLTGLAHYRKLVLEPAFEGENLASLRAAIERAEERLSPGRPVSNAAASAAHA